MKIDKETLYKIAELAKIKIKTDEEEKLMADMSSILNWVEKLNEVDTDGVEPVTQMTQEANQFRSDDTTHNISSDDALESAGKKMNGFFAVPKVIKRKNG